MGFNLMNWIIYTFLAIYGFMIIDFLIGFAKSFWEGTFNITFLGYLKDILYYVVPLNIIVSMIPIDPTGWTLAIVFFVGGLSVIIKYVLDIKNKVARVEK